MEMLRLPSRKQLQRLIRDESGPTAVEYAVMLAMIVVVCVGAIKTVGTNAKTTFTNVAGSLAS
jgi:pilus assembly protein Flp/PilA